MSDKEMQRKLEKNVEKMEENIRKLKRQMRRGTYPPQLNHRKMLYDQDIVDDIEQYGGEIIRISREWQREQRKKYEG